MSMLKRLFGSAAHPWRLLMILTVLLAPVAARGEYLLAPGDVIRSVNLRPVSTVGDLEDILDHTSPTRAIVLQVERDSQFLFLTVEQ